jgi:hypothetical protein
MRLFPGECESGGLRLHLAIDAGAGEATHVVFGFSGGGEIPLARELKISPISEVNVSFPSPGVVVPVSPHYRDESLVAVRAGNFVSGTFLVMDAHAVTLVFLESFSKLHPKYYRFASVGPAKFLARAQNDNRQ